MPDIIITPDEVIEQFGSFYIDEGQNLQSLLGRPFEQFGTREAFTNIPTDNTQLRYSDTEVSEVLQPYQDTFTPKGSVEFTPVTINLQPLKVDIAFNPSSLVHSWLGFLTSTNTDRTTWPFVRWLIEQYVMKQLFDDIETKAIYKGDLEVIVGGTAGTAMGSFDGIRKIRNAGITANKITPIEIGVLSEDPATFCTQVENYCKGMGEKYWGIPMDINLSRTLDLRYREGKKAKYNMNYPQESDLRSVANFEQKRVVGRASMQGSDVLWATPKPNAVFATKGFENATGFQIEKVDRKVKLYTDFHMGLGFLQKDIFFTNDSDLPA